MYQGDIDEKPCNNCKQLAKTKKILVTKLNNTVIWDE